MLTGLGFAMKFGQATLLELDCPGLLPEGGLSLDVEDDGHALRGAEEFLRNAMIIAAAMAAPTLLGR